MENNIKILAKYCEDFLVPNELFKCYFDENPCFIFLHVKNCNVEKNDLVRLAGLMAVQKHRNKQIVKDILHIQNLNSDFIGLKGYFIQRKYYPESATRLYNDIDILAAEGDGYCFYRKMQKVGYTVKPHRGIYRKVIHSPLMISLLKTIYTSNNKHIRLEKPSSTVVELHTNINNNCPRTTDSKFNTKEMFVNSIVQNIEGVNIKILSPEDNILYLMFHSIEHLVFIDLYGHKISISLQDIFDIIQIITLENINWEKFYIKAIEYNIIPYAAIFVRIINDIYKDVIPAKIIKKIFKRALLENFSWKIIYEKMQKMETYEIILGDYKKIPEIFDCYYRTLNSPNNEKIWKSLCDNGYKYTYE